ncbi:hypothetical protein OIDMADRAFT_16543 [Oidiodendron maius Zn]|uniref:Uncharacterized protein n=1 Tax=Oidiodendron maius (strain Zn) TaxID=913774 RepID=A0A0C3I1A4_OIDMZ|nr:hypothetical protein OIDMADRAFT_16543 [Oidiodendron maius Zn]
MNPQTIISSLSSHSRAKTHKELTAMKILCAVPQATGECGDIISCRVLLRINMYYPNSAIAPLDFALSTPAAMRATAGWLWPPPLSARGILG